MTPPDIVASPRRSPRIDWLAWSLLVVVLASGWLFRSMNLYDWDGTSSLHPDERFIEYTAYNLRVPSSFGDYLRSTCVRDGVLPNPKATVDGGQPIPADRQEPTLDSGCNTLNPRNYNWSRFFVYGTLPTSLARVVAEVRDHMAGGDGTRISPEDIRDVGRTQSALFDVGSVLLVFLIGRRLYGTRAGLLAALFMAMAVLPIQLAHFFTVDAATAFFTLFAIYWAVRIAQGGGIGAFVMLGIAIGCAMACRITMATLGLTGMLAVVVRVWGDRVRGERAFAPGWWRPDWPKLLSNGGLLALAGALSVLVFRVLAPDTFLGTSFFDVRPDPRFIEGLNQINGYVSGKLDAPFSQQWANRIPYVFALNNMVIWGLGLPLGLAAWASWLAALWQIIRRRALEHLIPVTWVGFYFAWQGGLLGQTMRYYALLYGLLAILAAWGVLALRGARLPAWLQGRAAWFVRNQRRNATILVAFVAAFTVLWAYAFTAIYRQPHTRISASRWIYANIPSGATISGEEWDDALPLSVDGKNSSQYQFIKMQPYAEDELSKYQGYTSPEGVQVGGLLDQLDQLDYIILTSNRVYGSATRLPMRYPALTRYYNTLFNGQLGFELAADIHSYPQIAGIEFPDQGAEEAFSVYDHPRVLIFHKTADYSRERAEQLLIGNIAFDEVYKIPTGKVRQVPTALRLTDQQWPFYRAAGTFAALFNPADLANRVPWLVWLLALEALGWAAFVLFRRPLRVLPDGGFALSKTLGVLALAYGAWILASIKPSGMVALVPFGPASVQFLGCGLIAGAAALAWRDRAALRAVWREKRTALLAAETLFLAAFALFAIIRALNPDLWHPARGGEKPMDLAFFTAVLKSPAFPPYDPWFAGGYINYYYFGFVLVGALTHLTGIVPTTAYNLAVATMFAMTVVGAWGVAYNLVAVQARTARERLSAAYRRIERRAMVSGLAAAIFVALAGNLAQALWLLPGSASSNDPTPAIGAPFLPGSYAAQQAARGRTEWAFWDATRTVASALQEGLINEFPFFTFLFADLHAHMIALPLALAVLGLILALYRAMALGGTARGPDLGRADLAWLGVLLALTIGALRVTNTWDYPVYLAIALASLVLAVWVWLRTDRDVLPIGEVIVRAAVLAALLLIGNTILFLPFHQTFATDYAGIALWSGNRTPTAEFLKINGLWLFVLMSAAALMARRAGFSRAEVLAVVGFVTVLAFGTALIGMSALLLALALVVVALLVVAELAGRIFTADTERAGIAFGPFSMLAALWALAATGAALLPEVVVAKGDIGRMNTLFKFGMQSWVLCGVLAGVALPWAWRRVQHAGMTAGYVWKGLATLLVAAALAYPLLATPARLADRYSTAIAPTLDGMAYMQAGAWSENGQAFDFREDAAALAWMRQTITGTPVVLEAHNEAYRWNGRVSVYTGLSTLLGWPWHETQQRSVTDIGAVLQSRQQLVRNLYSGTDQAETLRQLKLYGVEYVYVGQLERALYDPTGLAKFDAMTRAGMIQEVYRQGSTHIYQVSPSGLAPAITSTTLPVQTPSMPTERQPAMLSRLVGDLPDIGPLGLFGVQGAAQQIAAVLAWLVVWAALLALGLPIAALVFGRAQRWSDGGWAWARTIGLLIVGYCVWLPVSAQLWRYDRLGIGIGVGLAVLIAGAATFLLGRRSARRSATGNRLRDGLSDGLSVLNELIRANWRRIVWAELAGLAAFAVMLVFRALNPDLWQPYWGGEKPFEFGLLNGVVRSPVMPPYSPFFSDGTINYYYYGLFLMSLPIKALGIAPQIGFNLVIPTLFALFVSGLFALAARISGRARVGLAAVALVAIFGNLASVFPAGWSGGIAPVITALRGGLAGFGTQLGSWFVGPSRVIPNTINEFPYWGFLFADLHPHLIAMPIGMLALALTFELFSAYAPDTGGERFARRVALGLAALALGTLAVTNSWDLPTYACAVACGLLGATWRSRRANRTFAALVRPAIQAALVVAGGLMLYLPFFRSFVSPVGGLGAVSTPTSLSDYLLVYGIFLAVVVPVVIGASLRLARLPGTRQRRSSRALGIVASTPGGAGLQHLLVTVVAVLIGIAVLVALAQVAATALLPGLVRAPDNGFMVALARVQTLLGPRLLAPLLLLAALPLLLSRRIGDTTWFAVMLAVVGWLVSFAIELVFLRDHLAGGDWYRMNTVFKFGLQVWIFLALSAALLSPVVARWLRRAPFLQALPAGAALIVLVAIGLFFPLVGTISRVAYRFPVSPGPTLDGLAFMQDAVYTIAPEYIGAAAQGQPVTIALRSDGEAIRWLNEHIEGTPVVLQSSAEFYRLYGVRIAANTGLPTVVSPLHESEQRNPSLVAARDNDVQRIYRTLDPNEALRLLARYHVGYVYVGPIERLLYGADGTGKFDMMTRPDTRGLTALNEVYRNEAVIMYQVRPEVFRVPDFAFQPVEPGSGQATPAPVTGEPAQPQQMSLAALEQLAAANPADVSAAWQLAAAYAAQGLYNDAANALGRVAGDHPDDVGLQQFYGDMLSQAGRIGEAEAAYRRALTANPSPGNYTKLGTAFVQWGKLDQAEEVYQQAASAAPNTPEPQCGLGKVAELRGDAVLARDLYTRCRDLAKPGSDMRQQAEDGLTRLERSTNP